MIRLVMVNFKPGEYIKKDDFSVSDTGGSEKWKFPSAPTVTHDFLVSN